MNTQTKPKKEIEKGTIEISMFLRNRDGKTEHKREFTSKDGGAVSEFWNNNKLTSRKGRS